jgi:uncharacterized membrane protein YdjX (TVP38/TMEM64 family)
MAQSKPPARFPWFQTALLLAVIAALVWAGFALAPWFTRERMTALVRGAGAWGPAILLAIQVAQILLAPIPGVFVPVLAGFLYGPIVGPLVATVGTVLGSIVAYWVAGKAGRPLVERWVGAEKLDRAHALIGGKRWLALAALFLVPFSPSDALCFAAGIVGLPPKRFFLAVLLGRLPKDFALALAGAGLLKLGGWFPAG